PTYEKLTIFFTTSPSAANSVCPNGTRSTKIANTSWSPRPHATTRRLIARRLRDNANPRPRMNAIPSTPVRRWPAGRGGGAGDAGGGSDDVPWGAVTGAAGRRPAAWIVFQAKRGSVNTARGHTKMTG